MMITKTNKGFEESIKSLQPAPVGCLRSAFAVDITGPAWFSPTLDHAT